MIIVKSHNNIPIRLTTERWQHIIMRHPEMVNQREYLLETITLPHLIQRGDFDSFIAIRFYEKTPLTSKYLVVIYKELTNDGFVITAYYAAKPSERRQIVWKQ
jgi:hypothetical protein